MLMKVIGHSCLPLGWAIYAFMGFCMDASSLFAWYFLDMQLVDNFNHPYLVGVSRWNACAVVLLSKPCLKTTPLSPGSCSKDNPRPHLQAASLAEFWGRWNLLTGLLLKSLSFDIVMEGQFPNNTTTKSSQSADKSRKLKLWWKYSRKWELQDELYGTVGKERFVCTVNAQQEDLGLLSFLFLPWVVSCTRCCIGESEEHIGAPPTNEGN